MHGPRERRRTRAVLARIAPGAELARILQRRPAHARRDPVHTQHTASVAHADRRRRGKPVGERAALAFGAAAAEFAVALGVAVARIDRVEVVPDAQYVWCR